MNHAAGAAPAASRTMSDCALPMTDFITNDTTGLHTRSETFVRVPGMMKTITQGGSSPGCVIVDVSGYSFAPNGALELVSVKLDGVLGNPHLVQFSGDDRVYAEAHSAIFAFRNVTPGYHKVAMVYHTAVEDVVYMHNPAMTIAHQ